MQSDIIMLGADSDMYECQMFYVSTLADNKAKLLSGIMLYVVYFLFDFFWLLLDELWSWRGCFGVGALWVLVVTCQAPE